MGYLVEKVFKDTSGKALSELTSPWGGDSSALRAFAKSLSKELAKAGAPAADKTGDSALKTGENKELKQGLWFLKDVTTTDDTKVPTPSRSSRRPPSMAPTAGAR